MSKLVKLYKLNSLDYLQVCDLSKKVFRCFDLDGNALLDKVEAKILLQAFSNEMNTIGTSLSKDGFRKWF